MNRKLGSVLILICLVVMMVLPYFPFPEGVETGARLAVLAFVVASTCLRASVSPRNSQPKMTRSTGGVVRRRPSRPPPGTAYCRYPDSTSWLRSPDQIARISVKAMPLTPPATDHRRIFDFQSTVLPLGRVAVARRGWDMMDIRGRERSRAALPTHP